MGTYQQSVRIDGGFARLEFEDPEDKAPELWDSLSAVFAPLISTLSTTDTGQQYDYKYPDVDRLPCSDGLTIQWRAYGRMPFPHLATRGKVNPPLWRCYLGRADLPDDPLDKMAQRLLHPAYGFGPTRIGTALDLP